MSTTRLIHTQQGYGPAAAAHGYANVIAIDRAWEVGDTVGVDLTAQYAN